MSETGGEKGEFFVSRRGRKIGMHELDMTDINIETDNVAEATIQDAKKPEKKSKAQDKPRQKPEKTGRPKRTKLIIAGIVVLVLLLPVLLGELLAAQYKSGVTAASHDFDAYTNDTVLPMQKKDSVSSDQLRGVADKVNGIATTMCRGGLLDNAAALYPRAKTAYDACKAAQTKYSTLATGLYEMEGELRYLEKADACLKPVTTPITDEYAVIGAQQELWQTASDCVSKLSTVNELRVAHANLASHMTKVAEGWSKLNTASSAQDGAGFTEAEKTLATEYEAVRATAGGVTKVVATTQGEITAAYIAVK